MIGKVVKKEERVLDAILFLLGSAVGNAAIAGMLLLQLILINTHGR